VQLAASSSTAKRLCYTLVSPPVSGTTRPRIFASRKYTSGLHQTPTASLRDLTIAYSRLSSALTNPLPYLSEAQSSLNCLESTAWSRTDHLEIVSLKVHTSIVTQLNLASGCSASTPTQDQSARFQVTSSSIHFQRPVTSFAQHANNAVKCTRRTHMMTF